MNGKLHESAEILREFERQMEAAIDERIPRAGSGLDVRGRWPIFMFSGGRDVEGEERVFTEPFQLQMTTSGGVIRFTRGRVQAGSFVVIPTIGGFAVDDEAATLPLLANGGQVFARYRYTLNPLTAPYDWNDEFVSCELVQVGLDAVPPSPDRVAIGLASGVSAATGTAYTLLMCYAAGGRIIHYGQSSILPPDPNDEFPSDAVVDVFAQVMHVA